MRRNAPEKVAEYAAFSGVYVAAVTPHRKEGYEADFGATLELIDKLASAGVQGICLLGSTGEFLNIRFSDRIRLVHLSVKRSRVPIIAGVSHSTLDGAVELTSGAIDSGAAAVLLMPPYFFRYGQLEVEQFYLEFAAQIGRQIPLFLHNIPAFTTPIAIETARRLLGTGLFAGIKDSSGDFEYFSDLLVLKQQLGFRLLVGNEAIFSRSRQAGADGVISGVACAIPELMVALDHALCASDHPKVEALEAKLQEFLAWVKHFPVPVGVKIATEARGWKTGPLSVPLAPQNAAMLEEFRKWFQVWVKNVA